MAKWFKASALIGFMAILLLGQVSPAKALNIGVGWIGNAGMANRVSAGFEKAIKELAPDINIEFKKELASAQDLAQVVGAWQKDKDGMVILRSNGAEWLAKNPPNIPTFIGAANHPGQLGVVKNLKTPEGKITGVSYFLPVETQFEVFKAILPGMKSVLLLLEKGHPSSEIDRQETKAICAKLGLEYQEMLAASKDEAVSAVKAAQGKISVVIIGSQALIIDNTKAIVEAAATTPVLSYSSEPVKEGALAGFVADDQKLGAMLAESVVDVLKKGKAIKDVPIKFDPKPNFFLNAKTADRLKIEVPYTILIAATVIE